MSKSFASADAVCGRVSGFSFLSDDVVLKIFRKLEQDPRDWSRLACVCSRFSTLIRNACWKAQCYLCIPSIVSSLLTARFGDEAREEPPGGWAALYKLSVCCPGLLHAGVLLENSDFGLEREIGPDVNYRLAESPPSPSPPPASNLTSSADSGEPSSTCAISNAADTPGCEWSLYDDLYTDTMYDISECSHHQYPIEAEAPDSVAADLPTGEVQLEVSKRNCRLSNVALTGVHLAADPWSLIPEQASKLLAPRFRGDTLYISGRPGCVHVGWGGEGPREYMLFRGMFGDFKRSGVWRAILAGGGDGTRRGRVDVGCAFCPCRETWDLQSSFCLGRVASGYHDDGEPVVRAFVCENGHVAGAWTEPPNSD